MSNTDPSFIAPPALAAVGAVLTIAQAVPTVDKRLSRLRAVEQEIGRMPRLVNYYYVVPQRLYKAGLLLITFIGVVMVGAFLYRLAYPIAPMHAVFEALGTYGFWLIVAWFVIAITMYTNFLSLLAMGLGFLLTYPPVLRDVFGTDRLDRHPAWPALKIFVSSPEDAKPLIIDEQSAKGFADGFIQKLDSEASPPPNRAESPVPPAGADPLIFRQRIGNGLLVGCIIEEAHYLPNAGFPKRDWGPLYDAVEDLATQSDFLSAQSLQTKYTDLDFCGQVLADLNRRLQVRAQPLVPASPSLLQNLRATFGTLVEKYGGDATVIDPRQNGLWRSRWDIIRERVRALPAPSGESMRAQFVKLAVVWGIWPDLDFAGFEFAFSQRIAALLLDRAVIRVPSDVKSLRFDTPEERQIARAAERIVIAAAQRLIEQNRAAHAAWLPPQSRNTAGELFRWWIAYEIDFRMWDYAKRLHDNGSIAPADALTRWRVSDGQVGRVTKA